MPTSTAESGGSRSRWGAPWQDAGGGRVPAGELVVHVPVHASKLRSRGFDQARDLASACGRALALPAVEALERATRTAAMHDLGRTERARNVGGAFLVRSGWERRVAGRQVLLVDDVLTTGATMEGCALALLAAGAASVSGLVVARER